MTPGAPFVGLDPTQPIFVFDVESIGLHGEAYAVGGGVYKMGDPSFEFTFSCSPDAAAGEDSDRKWVAENCPPIAETCNTPAEVAERFWMHWQAARVAHPTMLTMAECLWPVESNFLTSCIKADVQGRGFNGPYPFHDVTTLILAASLDPMATYPRHDTELPNHHPLADARLSARLATASMLKLRARYHVAEAAYQESWREEHDTNTLQARTVSLDKITK